MSMTIGAQLYTLREHCTTLQDFALTLKKVADMGYTTVQVSGSCPYEGDWLQEQLQKNDLRCVITHTAPARILDNPRAVAAMHKQFDCHYVGIGSAPENLEQSGAYSRFRDAFLPAARALKGEGCYLMYHNHYMEFARDARGRRYIERMAEDFAPDEMGFTLDTYWVQYAGGDPAEWIDRLSGRVPCIHLKDMKIEGGAQLMAPVGEGNLNFDRILAHAEKAQAAYLLVEQDDCYGEDPFDCLRRSMLYLHALGLK